MKEANIKAITVPVDSKPELVTIPNELDSFKESIGGGWIEVVAWRLDGTPLDGILDEEGKIKYLPGNPLATLLTHESLFPNDYIAGDFLIVGDVDEEGDFTSVPDGVYEKVLEKWGLVSGDIEYD